MWQLGAGPKFSNRTRKKKSPVETGPICKEEAARMTAEKTMRLLFPYLVDF